jgi:RimJ/RimL family protein N-acetyltransferase
MRNLEKIDMTISKSLYESDAICLAPIDHEKDPGIESQWTHDAEYQRLLGPEPTRPLSPAQVKKKYEEIEKSVETSKGEFYFTIRIREDDRLIGYARLYWIDWANGNANVEIGIGDPKDRRRGYGTQTLGMLSRMAFIEFNLFRITAHIQGFNKGARALFEKAGFVEEVRRREAIYRDGKRWDLIHLGLLREEWEGRE